MGTRFYCGEDVHQYESALRERRAEFPKAPLWPDFTSDVRWVNRLAQGDAEVLKGLNNIEQNKDCHDQRLAGLKVSDVFIACVRRTQVFKAYPLLLTTLKEIGSTCLQGITVRLLACYFALEAPSPPAVERRLSCESLCSLRSQDSRGGDPIGAKPAATKGSNYI